MRSIHAAFAALGLALAGSADAADWFTVPASDPHIEYLGRTWEAIDASSKPMRMFGWSGTSATLRFEGTAIKALVTKAPGASGIDSSWYKVILDGKESKEIAYKQFNSASEIVLAEGLAAGIHTVTFYKRTEIQNGSQGFRGFSVLGEPALPQPPKVSARRLEFIGNSITCGYGNLDSCKVSTGSWTVVNCPGFTTSGEDHWHTYAAVAARALGADYQSLCWSGKGVFRNNAGSANTPTIPQLWEHAQPLWSSASAVSVPKWDFKSWVPSAVVIDLGTNDFNYSTAPDSAAFENAYFDFLQRIRQEYGTSTPILLLDGPMLGDSYPPGVNALTRLNQHLDNLVVRMGGGVRHASLMPNQSTVWGVGADWHPNRRQNEFNAQEVVGELQDMLGWSGPADSVSVSVNRAASRRDGGLVLRAIASGRLEIAAPFAGEMQLAVFDFEGRQLLRATRPVRAGVQSVALPVRAVGPVVVRARLRGYEARAIVAID